MSKHKNFQQLKIDLQRHFGTSILEISDLKMFQDAVEYSTQKSIGFNTLRRFFGFLPETSPSIKTINLLSKYLGYENYFSYLKYYSNDNEWANWARIIKIESTSTIIKNDLNWLETQTNSPDFHLKLASIIKSLTYKQQYGPINQLFDRRIINFSHDDQLKFAHNMCMLLGSISEEDLHDLIVNLIPNSIFRENIIHWYIDYSKFNGYYGTLIESGITYAKIGSHERLFFELILNYKDFLSQKGQMLHIPSNRIKTNFHPVLKGRLYGYNLIYFHQKNDKKNYEKTWKTTIKYMNSHKNEVFLFTIEVVPALLLLKDFEKTNFLIEHYYEEILTPTNWSGYHIHSNVLLAITIEAILANKLKQANKTFSLINISKLNTGYKEYNLIFYYLVKYHLALLNKESKNVLNEIEEKYNSHVKSTGFTFFSKEFLVNYFS